MKRRNFGLLLALVIWGSYPAKVDAGSIYYAEMYQDDFPAVQLQGGTYNLYDFNYGKSVPGDFQSGTFLTQYDLLRRDPATVPGYSGPFSPAQTVSLEGTGHYWFNFYSDKLDLNGYPQLIAKLDFTIAIHGSAQAPFAHDWFQGVVRGVGTDANLILFPADVFSDQRRPEWSTGTVMPADVSAVNQGLPASLIDLVAHPERIQFSGHVSGSTMNYLVTTVSIAPPGDLSAYAVPEPAALTTFLVGLSGILAARWRRRTRCR